LRNTANISNVSYVSINLRKKKKQERDKKETRIREKAGREE
jgi:hypothetical protein